MVVEVVKSFLVVDDEDVSPVDCDEVFVFSDIEKLFVKDFLVQFLLAFFLFHIELVWVEWVEHVVASLFVGFELFHVLGILLVTYFDDTFEVITEVVERVRGFGPDFVGIDEDTVVVVTHVLGVDRPRLGFWAECDLELDIEVRQLLPDAFDDEDEVCVVVFCTVHDPRVDDFRTVTEVLLERFGEERSDVQFEVITVLDVVGCVFDKRVGGVTGDRVTSRLAEYSLDSFLEAIDAVILHPCAGVTGIDSELEAVAIWYDDYVKVDAVVEGSREDPLGYL